MGIGSRWPLVEKSHQTNSGKLYKQKNIIAWQRGDKMSHNVLTAIANIVAFGNNDLKSYASTYLIKINAVGEQLEFYIKDALAASFKLPQVKKQAAYSQVFSYLGNQNNPSSLSP